MIDELTEIVPHLVDYNGSHTAYGKIRIHGQNYWICIDADDTPYFLTEDGVVCQPNSPDDL